MVVSHECYRKKKMTRFKRKRMPPDAPPPQDSDDENELELESVEHCQQHPTFDAMRLYLQSLQDMSLDDRQNEVMGECWLLL
jgi:hypothetical protein